MKPSCFYLAQGTHSTVYLLSTSSPSTVDPGQDDPQFGRSALTQFVVRKVVDLALERARRPHKVAREIRILDKLRGSPNIVPLLSHSTRPTHTILTFPYHPLSLAHLLSCPSFSPHLLPIPSIPLALPPRVFEALSRSIIYQLFSALSQLHQQRIAHRDLNPSNVLVAEDGRVILIDFGVAWEGIQGDLRQDGTGMSMVCDVGTNPYRAPELLFSPLTYDPFAIDLWSLGVLIASLFAPLIYRLPDQSLSSLSSSPSSSTSPSLGESSSCIPSPRFILLPEGRGWHDLSLYEKTNGSWERKTLFSSEFGDIGLAGSIFSVRGSPTLESWPEFAALPDASKLYFPPDLQPKDLCGLLPSLPTTPSSTSSTSQLLDLLDALLQLSPSLRSNASHPYLAGREILLPIDYDLPHNVSAGFLPTVIRELAGQGLKEILHPFVHEKKRMDRAVSDFYRDIR